MAPETPKIEIKTVNEEEEARRRYEEMVKQARQARAAIRKGCEENPLYFNDSFDNPWEYLAK